METGGREPPTGYAGSFLNDTQYGTFAAVALAGVAAVQVLPPAPNAGPPPPVNPVLDSVKQLSLGNVSISSQGVLDYVPTDSAQGPRDSYNLGELAGLSGALRLAPIGFALGALVFFVRRSEGRNRTPPRPVALKDRCLV